MNIKAPQMIKRYTFLVCTLFLVTTSLYSQVGIGTTSPTAELEILSKNIGIPSLELDPQSAPVGSATGQLAVIGDMLFMYDATRVKWLSVETTALQFGVKGSKEDQYMKFGGDVKSGGSGAMMPYGGTITAITIIASGGASNKGFEVHINGSANTTYYLVSRKFSTTSANIDFNAGDSLQMYIAYSGVTVQNSVAVIWVKWRK